MSVRTLDFEVIAGALWRNGADVAAPSRMRARVQSRSAPRWTGTQCVATFGCTGSLQGASPGETPC